MVGQRPNDCPIAGGGSPRRQLDDPVMVVDPVDDGLRVAEDRSVAGQERCDVLGQDLGAGIDDERRRRAGADDGRGDHQRRRVLERLVGEARLLAIAEDIGARGAPR